MTDTPSTSASGGNADKRLDLTPREVDEVGTVRRGILPKLVLVGVVIALGFVLLQTLGSASLFFYNADEAVERRDELIDQRFRIQGTPFGDPTEVEVEVDGSLEVGVAFPINFDGAVIDVVHIGAPAELFQPNVPVVLEGRWVQGLPDGVEPLLLGADDGWHFASTEMIVKHDNEYRNDNEERLNEAEQRGFTPDP